MHNVSHHSLYTASFVLQFPACLDLFCRWVPSRENHCARQCHHVNRTQTLHLMRTVTKNNLFQFLGSEPFRTADFFLATHWTWAIVTHPTCLHLARLTISQSTAHLTLALQISGALLFVYGMWTGVTRKPSCTTYRCSPGQATTTGHVQTFTLTSSGKIGIHCSCLVFRSMSHENSWTWKRCVRSPLGWMTIYSLNATEKISVSPQ